MTLIVLQLIAHFFKIVGKYARLSLPNEYALLSRYWFFPALAVSTEYLVFYLGYTPSHDASPRGDALGDRANWLSGEQFKYKSEA